MLRPLVLSRMQDEIVDDVRATMLSLQSLRFTLVVAISEPILGMVSDDAGLPSAYVMMAGGRRLLDVVSVLDRPTPLSARRGCPRPGESGPRASSLTAACNWT